MINFVWNDPHKIFVSNKEMLGADFLARYKAVVDLNKLQLILIHKTIS